MSETQQFTLTLTQESDYVFRIAFDDTAMPDLIADESAPLGTERGPNPSRMLVAAVANCLSASLLFALRKFKNAPGTLVTRAQATLGRNAAGRLRVQHIAVTLELPEALADYAAMTAAMKDHVLASGQVIGLGRQMPPDGER